MRKHQTLLVAGILLLATAVAVQAAQIYDVRGIRAMGREGGGAEPAGEVVLFSLSTGVAEAGGSQCSTLSRSGKIQPRS